MSTAMSPSATLTDAAITKKPDVTDAPAKVDTILEGKKLYLAFAGMMLSIFLSMCASSGQLSNPD